MSIHRKSHTRTHTRAPTHIHTQQTHTDCQIGHQITIAGMNDVDFLKRPRGIDGCIFLLERERERERGDLRERSVFLADQKMTPI